MTIRLFETNVEEILHLRELYRREMDCQIVHDSAYYREGCTRSFLLKSRESVIGYASIWVGDYWMSKGSLFEFFLLADYRSRLFTAFEYLLREMQPAKIYAQTNDPFLGSLIYDHVGTVVATHILFKAGAPTYHFPDGMIFRRLSEKEGTSIFQHRVEPVGTWGIEKDGRIIATGDILYHYNPPYGDIFMEVDADFQRQGVGRFLVQELTRLCRESGKAPSARCRPTNLASRKTLEAAGFIPTGRLIYGDTL